MLNISLRKIDGSSEFYCLNKLWNKLLQQSAVDTIFLTWEWMYTWWECFNDGKRLFIVTAKVDDEIVGIAPLHVTRSLLFGILSRRSLEFLGSDGVITEYSDFIIKKGKEDIILPLFLDFIFQNTSEWDLLNLTSINQNSVNLKKIKSYCVNKGLKLLDYNFNVSPFIELPATIDQYLKTLSNKSRWKFKNYRKKLQNARKVDLILTDDKRNLKKNLQLIMELHQKRWESKGGRGSFHHSNTNFLRFHKLLSERFFNNSWLNLILLTADSIPVAGHYSFIYQKKVYCHSVGFDPDWSSYNVGSVLQLYAIEDAIRRGVIEFDFLRGSEEYKYYWTKKEHVSVDIAICKNISLEARLLFEKKIRKAVRKLLPDRFAEKIYSGLTRNN